MLVLNLSTKTSGIDAQARWPAVRAKVPLDDDLAQVSRDRSEAIHEEAGPPACQR